MSITPLGNRVLVKLDKKEEKTAGGFVLPTDKLKQRTRGSVVTVSADVTTISIGDIVLFAYNAGEDVQFDNDEYKVIDADDILAIIK